MRRTRFLPLRPMSKQDVLDTIRDTYRFSERLDEAAERGVNLTFETTVEELLDAFDWEKPHALGTLLNAWFDVRIDALDWRATLEPVRVATLGDVCELVASQAQKPAIEPFSVCGTECRSAGAFLAIRSALAREGVPVDGLLPSTLVAPVARAHLEAFIRALGRIAPNTLPLPEVTYKLAHRVAVRLFWAGAVSLLASLATLSPRIPNWISPRLMLLALGCMLVGVLMNLLLARDPFRTFSFPGVTSFRDLTEAVIRRT